MTWDVALVGNDVINLTRGYFQPPGYVMLSITPNDNPSAIEAEVKDFQQAISQSTPANNLLFLRGNLLTAQSAQSLNTILQAINNSHADIIYLTRWLDRCDLAVPVADLLGTGARLLSVKEPHGIVAVVVTPSGKAKLLGTTALPNGSTFKLDDQYSLSQQITNLVATDQLEAQAVAPNLFIVNYIGTEGNELNYARTSECQVVDDPQNGNANVTSHTWIWCLIIILILVLVALLIGISYGF